MHKIPDAEKFMNNKHNVQQEQQCVCVEVCGRVCLLIRPCVCVCVRKYVMLVAGLAYLLNHIFFSRAIPQGSCSIHATAATQPRLLLLLLRFHCLPLRFLHALWLVVAPCVLVLCVCVYLCVFA